LENVAMTRINVVPPEELHSKHLVAEYRELPRIFKLAVAAYQAGRMPPKSDECRLGTGHVAFFYDKLGFLRDRQRALIAEMLRRGYNPTHVKVDFEFPDALLGSWQPDAAALAINRQRIAERQPSAEKPLSRRSVPSTMRISVIR
jgi:deoxyribonuclease (pyrimidine dimer)